MIYSILTRTSPQNFLFKKNEFQFSKCLNVILFNKYSASTEKSTFTRKSLDSSKKPSLLYSDTQLIQNRFLNTNMVLKNDTLSEPAEKNESNGPKKKTSKFKLFYTQYGPIFLVVHLTTVVMWIYGFFLISKQYV